MDIPISPGCRIPMRSVTCVSSLPDVLRHPAENGFMPPLAIERSEDPMPFIGEDQSFRRHTVAPKSGEKLQALIHRYTKILFIRDDQCRRFDFVGGQMWRAPREMAARRSTPGRSARFPVREPESFTLQRHGFKVEAPVVCHCRLESIRMSDQPIDGVAAIARACEPLPLSVNKWQFTNCI